MTTEKPGTSEYPETASLSVQRRLKTQGEFVESPSLTGSFTAVGEKPGGRGLVERAREAARVRWHNACCVACGATPLPTMHESLWDQATHSSSCSSVVIPALLQEIARLTRERDNYEMAAGMLSDRSAAESKLLADYRTRDGALGLEIHDSAGGFSPGGYWIQAKTAAYGNETVIAAHRRIVAAEKEKP